MAPFANASYRLRTLKIRMKTLGLWSFFALLAALTSAPALSALRPPQSDSGGVTIQGSVHTSDGAACDNAVVRMELKGAAGAWETRSNNGGLFAFSALKIGTYILSAERSGLHSRSTAVILSSLGERRLVDLVLEDSAKVHSDSNAASLPATQAMEFADKPTFTIAGVTDWTAAGGHGSDTSLRTSEALTRETLTLKADQASAAPASAPAAGKAEDAESTLRSALAAAPSSFAANRRLGEFYLHAGSYREALPLLQAAYRIDPGNRANEIDLALACKETGDLTGAREHVRSLLASGESADLHRLAGEVDESLDDPLSAVHEFEQAARMTPSEQNYFEWGSELLLHRAVWQAQEVFEKGVRAYPKSARMLTALGTALFSSALYDQAALRICDASDLNPADPEPYLFLGRIELVAPDPLTCVQQKLERFVREQPQNSVANYLYAMDLWKRQLQSSDPQGLQQVEALLTKAVTLDAKCADASLQLGNLASSQHSYQKAIGFYSKAIEANPQLAEAYYRLGMAYDRVGDTEKARQAIQRHDEIRKQQAATVDRERHEVKQFLVVKPGQATTPPSH